MGCSRAWLLTTTTTTSTDERFPFQASVEFVFSSSPEKIKGKSGSWRGKVLKVLGAPDLQYSGGFLQATLHGMIPLSLWIITQRSLLYAGIPTRTSTSTMRTVWMVCGVEDSGVWGGGQWDGVWGGGLVGDIALWFVGRGTLRC